MDSAFGARIPRFEDVRFVTGRGSYVADIEMPRTLYLKFVRSPYGHARIKGIDKSEALKMPGVYGVFTYEDIRDGVANIPTAWVIPNSDIKAVPYPPLANGKVRYAGEAVAAVLASDQYTAEDAVEKVKVDYEPLLAVTTQEEALKEGAPQLHEEAPGNVAFRWTVSGGDVDGEFRKAKHVLKKRIVNQRLQPAAMEPRAALASYDSGRGELTLYVTSQNPHVHRLLLSLILSIPEHRIRVISPDVGGGFGSKIPVYPWEAIACYLAIKTGRPIKWVEDRTENFLGTIHGRDHVQDIEVAFDDDGKIRALKVSSLANMGAYLSTAGPGVPTILFGLIVTGCYDIRAASVTVTGVFTNTTPTDAYRGAGRPEASYIIERVVDMVAQKLKMDPAEVRMRNFIRPEDFPHPNPLGLVYDSGNYQAALRKALEKVGYEELRKEQEKARKEGRLIGIGISSYVEMCGLGPSTVVTATGFGGGLWGSSTIRVHPTGKVQVLTGAHPHGQGEETTFAQIVAKELGVPVEDVEIVHGDTELTPMGMGTYGSRTTPVEGGSIALSARKVVEKARKIAASLLEVSEGDLEFSNGRFSVKGAPTKSVSIQEVANAAYMASNLPKGVEPMLEATTFYDPENFVFPFGTHVCVVEIDRETGKPHILRYVAVDDCGPQINPMIVEGQVHGGVAQGLAQAMYEQSVYDKDGNLLTSSFMEYLVPGAMELPNIETDSTVTPSPHNPLGVKGIGEAGTIASPQAFVNAVVDALREYGVDHIDMPVTPEKVWRVIHGKR
ncbi:aldehyde dehydrogenase [Thermogymnomonas acidicola]|uniref:Aldehyde dehydrogenase n=1 Tax=Thermogymnomonas acidicola TaxID=399579 RepID=A0AA37BRI8_9ARCH|nr:molybdopterin cofactor-binding domain-containing protein [Thermogymnomonas acidicola]GGM71171.1 aldehyde dehydrogenase [Thermogymnomonas acidicola]